MPREYRSRRPSGINYRDMLRREIRWRYEHGQMKPGDIRKLAYAFGVSSSLVSHAHGDVLDERLRVTTGDVG